MIDWKYPIVLGCLSFCAAVSYYRIDPLESITYSAKTLIKLLFAAFIIYQAGAVLTSRLKQSQSSQQTVKHEDNPSEKTEKNKTKRKEAIAAAQAKQDEQAHEYKERILSPREEAKRKKKEDEFYRSMGPAWKGKGEALGGEDSRHTSPDSPQSPGAEAREVRKLPPDVKLHIPKPPDTRKQKRYNISQCHLSTSVLKTSIKDIDTKRELRAWCKTMVIELPEEPIQDGPDTTTIILRTPLGTKHKRRFLRSYTLQVVLDFMTTVGFHQGHYALSMSYPRRPLIDQSEVTLEELDFGQQMVLNIEEKDL